MSVAIKQECKVPAFDYFQQNISLWENWHIKYQGTINQILEIYKKQLSEKKDKISARINTGFNDQFETYLNESVTELNNLSKKYLDDDVNYDINLSNKISDYISAYKDYIEKRNKVASIEGPSVIDNAALENKIRALAGEIENMKEAILTKKTTNEEFVKTKNGELAQNIAKISETKETITNVDVLILELIAKEKLEEIKKKHYEKLLKSNENEFKLKEITEKGETTFLEVQLRQLLEEFEENKEENIVGKITKKYEDDIRAKMKDEGFTPNIGSSNVKNKGWLDEDEKKEGKYQIKEEDLYAGNEQFKAIGEILSDTDSVASNNSKIFSKIKKGYTNVLTVDSKTINNNLEKL